LISDSPYRSGELVLPPLGGLAGGLVGSVLMLFVVAVLEPLSHIAVSDVLSSIGVLVTGAGAADPSSPLVAGAVLQFVVGGLLGLLYALSEQRGPRGELAFVGLFYGFVLWVFGGVILTMFMSPAARAILRSLPFLGACLAYGFWLALLAIWASRRAAAAAVLPKD
jgi:hypothetical protein